MVRSRGDATFTVMGGILALLLVVGATLFLFLVRSPTGKAAADISEAKAITCPVGSHAPVCYQFVLTNVGAAAGQFGCRAHPAEGSSAIFDTGASTYVVPVDGPLPVGKDLTLTVLSESLNGKDVVGVPQVGCDPLP